MERNQHSTSNRGFASMDQDQQREIARKGGQSVAPENRSFSRDHNLAREAGRKGGEASHSNGNSNRQYAGSGDNSGNFANDRGRASEAGRKGGSH